MDTSKRKRGKKVMKKERKRKISPERKKSKAEEASLSCLRTPLQSAS
jgi:hypothetical protein